MIMLFPVAVRLYARLRFRNPSNFFIVYLHVHGNGSTSAKEGTGMMCSVSPPQVCSIRKEHEYKFREQMTAPTFSGLSDI